MTGAGRPRAAAGVVRGLAAAVSAAGLVLAARPFRRPVGRPAWTRRNWRDRPVSLAGGPMAVGGALAAAPSLPAVVAAGTALAVGRYDDVAGARPEQHRDKGFRGHLAALRAGRVSAGLVKVVAIGGAALVAASTSPASRRRAVPTAGGRGPLPVGLDVGLDAALVAGTANLVNLLDLRPGRALKVVAAGSGVVLLRPGAHDRRPAGALVGAALAALPDDVGERTMLGDAGANGLGVLLGLSLVGSTGRRGRLGLLGGVVALTAASERVSFSAVIERTPALAWLDGLGRPRDPASGR